MGTVIYYTIVYLTNANSAVDLVAKPNIIDLAPGNSSNTGILQGVRHTVMSGLLNPTEHKTIIMHHEQYCYCSKPVFLGLS